MNISSKNKSNKKIVLIIVSLVVIVIAAATGFFWLQNQSSQSPQSNMSDETDSSTINVEDNSQEALDREEDKVPLQNDSAAVDQSNLTGYITAKNIVNGKLQIRIQIDQYFTSGTCKITIGDYSEQADIITNPSSSTCKGWDIPVSNLQNGTQPIKIDINSGSNNLIINDEIAL